MAKKQADKNDAAEATPADDAGEKMSIEAGLPAGFVIDRAISTPTLKLAVDVPVYVMLKEPMEQGKKIETESEKGRPPATVAKIVNLATGEDMTMVIPAVVKGVLEDNYPNDEYVNKYFAIVKKPMRAGKRYFDYIVKELHHEGITTNG